MTRLALAAACCVLALGTAAQAQVSNVGGSSSTSVALDGTYNFTNTGPGEKDQGLTNGAAFYSSFTATPSTISFESANASSGVFETTTSTTSASFTITNGGAASVLPSLTSTLTAGGLGLYLADRTGGCGGSGLFGAGGDKFGGCPQVKSGSFQDLRQVGDIGQNVAGAAFDFKITAGGATVYELTGMETLFIGDGNGLQLSGLQETLTIGGVSMDPTGVLNGLTEVTPGAPNTADGFLWNASVINGVALGGALDPGMSRDIVYSATVSTFSTEGCATADLSECLVPFSAFGDPIGRSGAIGSAPILDGPNPFFKTIPGSGIPYVDDWAPQVFSVPTFDFNTGVVNFNGVPEPKTWMSMILGFGLLGAALRRRRILGYT